MYGPKPGSSVGGTVTVHVLYILFQVQLYLSGAYCLAHNVFSREEGRDQCALAIKKLGRHEIDTGRQDQHTQQAKQPCRFQSSQEVQNASNDRLKGGIARKVEAIGFQIRCLAHPTQKNLSSGEQIESFVLEGRVAQSKKGGDGLN